MKPETSLTLKISVIARMLRTRFDTRARSIGITRAQWRTIAAVRRAEGAPQRRIAEMLEVGDVTAGRLIDRLSDEGWIERRPDPADRRAYRVYLTPEAAPVLERLSALGADEERRAFAGIDPEELDLLGDILDRIAANLHVRCTAEDVTTETVEAGKANA